MDRAILIALKFGIIFRMAECTTTPVTTTSYTLETAPQCIVLCPFGTGRYTVTFRIGSGEKLFRMVLDTGSAVVWVPSITASAIWTKHNLYDPSQSETASFKDSPFRRTYGTKVIKGRIFEDRIKVGELTFESFAFGAADEVVDYPIYEHFDGVLGMAIKSEHEGLRRTFLERLANRKFGLFFRSGEEESIMVVGDEAEKYMPREAYQIPLTSESYWTVKFHWMFVGRVSFNMNGYRAVLDTGSIVTDLPTHIMEAIDMELKVTGLQGVLHQVDCSKIEELPAIELLGDEVQLKILPSQYILQEDFLGHHYCYIPFREQANPRNRLFIVGISILRAFDLLFDANEGSVTFAPKDFQSSAFSLVK